MKFKEWNEVAELIGMTAIVASLIFVGLQMKQAQDIANAERRQARVINLIELNNSINEHVDIWSRGKSGEKLNETEALIFENLIHNMNDHLFFASRAASDLGNEFGAAATRIDFSSFLNENPGALLAFNAHATRDEKYRNILMPELGGGSDWADSIRSDLLKLNQISD